MRDFTGVVSAVDKFGKKLFARTTEEGSRAIVFAALGGGEEMRGAYINLQKVQEPSDEVLDGALQKRIWVRSNSGESTRTTTDACVERRRRHSVQGLSSLQSGGGEVLLSIYELFMQNNVVIQFPFRTIRRYKFHEVMLQEGGTQGRSDRDDAYNQLVVVL